MALSGIGSNSGWYQIDQAWAQSRQRIAKQFLQQSETFSSALTSSAQDQICAFSRCAADAAERPRGGAWRVHALRPAV
jgi:hypothetical protein